MRKLHVIIIILYFVMHHSIASSYASFYEKPSVGTKVCLLLENEPIIGGDAILKLIVTPSLDASNIDIVCTIPDELDFINDNDFTVEHNDMFGAGQVRIVLWSGPVRAKVNMEFIIRVVIPDGKKYFISAGAGGGNDSIEIDLGDPEPPIWDPTNKEKAGLKNGEQLVLSGVKKMVAGKEVDLMISEASVPILRAEIGVITKGGKRIKPEIGEVITLRLLINSVHNGDIYVSFCLPRGMELQDVQDGKTGKSITRDNGNNMIKIFGGHINANETKSFYIDVIVNEEARYIVKPDISIVTDDGNQYNTDCAVSIFLGRRLE